MVNSLTQWVSSVFARSEPGRPDPETYFTPRLAEADQQLQALAARLSGSYRQGALEWSALAPADAAPAEADGALWGRGSRVVKRLHGLEIEISAGVQSLLSGQSGEGFVPRWLVLVPGVTVTAGPRSAPLVFNRYAAGWSADEDLATGADRLRDLLKRGAGPAIPPPSMPAAVTSARDRVIEKASKLVCTKSQVFVIGKPMPRAARDPRHFGQGNFDVAALNELVERARAFAHALATA